ncbi:MAG: DUF2892 domain-containing protein [Azospirillum sp.]|nr:DUF2892 domain-containing protein [Azospirillum sp.]
MTRNIGTVDRLLRIAAGLGLLSLLYWLEGDVRWVGLVGVVPLVTAAVSWCPAYRLLGIRTCALGSPAQGT